ncbi:MAG TPA: phage major capsid protein [Terracidiphilus sp.]|nr:phage major capsid protein [Terracidiphilus sp.]
MTLRELIEKRNRTLAEARQLMSSSAELSVEQRTKVDAMLADANAVKADIERLEACAETEERSLPTNRPPREGFESGDADNRSQEERNAASNKAFRSYLRGERFETRDLTVAADGGVMIPVAAVPPIVAQRSAGAIYDIVGHLRTTTGEDVRFPLWDDTGNGLVLDSAAIGGGTDPSVNGVTIKTDGLRTGDPLLLDNKLVQDVSYDLVSYVNQALTQRYVRGVSQAIANGNSSNFVGLYANIPTINSESAGALGYDDFPALISALDPAYHSGACFTFSNATLGLVLKIKDSQGRPIFLPYLDGAKSGFAGQILGFPVKVDQYAATVATGHVAVAFGDFSMGYQCREVLPGLVIKQSNQRWIELNRLGVVAFARAGGAPTLANTTDYSPIQGLKIQ